MSEHVPGPDRPDPDLTSGFVCARCGEAAPTDDAPCPACGGAVALEGRFALRRIVGQGAVGTTWRALDRQTGQPVAVKEMPIRPGTPLHLRDRMAREARVLRELDHPRIPAYVAHFEAGAGRHRAFYVVQTFVEGRTLAAEVAERRLSQAQVVEALDAVLAVLEYLHGLAPPVIHRDLKPGNVIRRSDGALVLIDFGAVRDVVNDPKVGGSTIAGTYGYMAPEQFRGVATPATDLYAVGAMAVGLLSRQDVVDLVGADHRLDWAGAVHAAPGLVALIERLLADDPADRPQSAREVRAALAAVDLDAAPSATPAKRPAADLAVGLRPDLPPAAVSRLKASVAVDEPILWSGRPPPGGWRKSGCGPVLFAIPWTGFALFWTVAAFVMTADAGPFHYFFPLFGLPFVLIGVSMLTAPLRARNKHRRTLYAVTDRQALEVRGPLWPQWWDAFNGDGVQRFRGSSLAYAERRDRRDGRSDFVIERTVGRKGAVTEKGLMGVTDGDEVQRLLRAAADYAEARDR